MKITKSQLIEIIKEELDDIIQNERLLADVEAEESAAGPAAEASPSLGDPMADMQGVPMEDEPIDPLADEEELDLDI